MDKAILDHFIAFCGLPEDAVSEIKKMLAGSGFNIAGPGDKPGVIICGAGIIESEGKDFYKKITGNPENEIAVLFASRPEEIGSVRRLAREYASDYTLLPPDRDELLVRISGLVERKRLLLKSSLLEKVIMVQSAGRDLLLQNDLDELLKKIIDTGLKISGSDSGSVMLIDSKNQLTVKESRGIGQIKQGHRNRGGSKIADWVAENREPLIINSGSPTNLPHGIELNRSNIKSSISFPLKTGNRIIGVLNLNRGNPDSPFDEEDIQIADIIDSFSRRAIDNSMLYDDIWQNCQKTVRAFANAVEVKDLYTRGHSENVMAYSVKIANELGLDEQLLETIKYGGLLHDIGKIGIGENILNKPGRLTEEEFEVIKFHPALGANIIQDVPYFRDIVPLVMHHHEFFDGRGYPDGLSGTEIPYGARILSVADAFEAMTSDRPYRKSLDINLAKNILIENKGTQFDPDIVDVFVKIIDLDLDYKYDERD